MIELKRLTRDELRRELASHRSEYAKVRLHIHAQSEKNHAQMKILRRNIARMTMVYGTLPSEPRKGAEGTEGTKGAEVKKGKIVTKKSAKKTSATSATSVPSVPSKKK